MSSIPEGLDGWRAQLLDRVITAMLIVGTLLAIPSIWFAMVNAYWAIAIVDLLALLLLISIRRSSSIGHRARTLGFLMAVYAVGVALIPVVELVGAAYLFAVPILAALLLGRRAATLALLVNVAAVLISGLVGQGDASTILAGFRWPVEWAVAVTNVLVINGALTMSCDFLLQRLERSERASLRLRLAIADTPDAIIVADATGLVVVTNRAAAALFEGPANGHGRHLHDLARTDDQRATLDAAVTQWAPAALTLHGADAGVELEAHVTPAFGPDGNVHSVVAVLRDVTQQRRVEAELLRAEKLAAMSVGAGAAAHDFSNVLTQILSVADAARAHTDDDRLLEDFDAILGASERARDLVRQLVSPGDTAAERRKPIDMARVIATALPMLRSSLSHTGATIEVRLDPAFVSARVSEVEQILTNLATNAAHATKDEPDPRITVEVTSIRGAVQPSGPTAHRPSGQVELTVSDNGCGIPQSDLARIFEPLFTTKAADGGTGLGLSSVRRIVEVLGGELEVTSELGAGTRIRVMLPAAASPGPSEPRSDAATRRRILLVEDEPLIRELATKGLERWGCAVETAGDGELALQTYRERPDDFDLIITDLALPGLDGEALIEAVLGIRSSQPVLVCSGRAADHGRHQPHPAAWLSKPYSLGELQRAVEDALGRVGSSDRRKGQAP